MQFLLYKYETNWLTLRFTMSEKCSTDVEEAEGNDSGSEFTNVGDV